MAKKTKHLSRKEKTKNHRELTRIRRAIGEHLERRQAEREDLWEGGSHKVYRLQQIRNNPEELSDTDECLDYAGEEEYSEESTNDLEHDPLWVLEPEDLNELSLSEVGVIWDNRLTLCGSIEVAAEALAILRVDRGDDTTYQGWQSYVGHDDIAQLKDELPSLYALDQINLKANGTSKVPIRDEMNAATVILSSAGMASVSGIPEVASMPRPEVENRLDRNAVLELSHESLLGAWEARPGSFSTVSAACEALAIIRFTSGIDKEKREWRSFVGTEIIQDISDQLESDGDTDTLSLTSAVESSLVGLDERIKVSRAQVYRVGQKDFRDAVLAKFSGQCCVTGCPDSAVLEAAHIMPYMGDHSNLVDNGLLLRVDLHRLFDRFLITVNPELLSLVVSANISDEFYQSLSGRPVSITATNLTRQYLRRHYETFSKVCR